MAKKKAKNPNGNVHPTRLFKTPEDLNDLWEEYKAQRKKDSKDWPVTHFVGREGEERWVHPVLPLILDGFYVYARRETGEIEQYFTNKDGYCDDFVSICRAIKQEIRDQQITGGMLNQFNSSITQRLNGLVDKTEREVKKTKLKVLIGGKEYNPEE